MEEKEENPDYALQKSIEELAFTFRRKGLAVDMEEALEKAKAIILANKEAPFAGWSDPAVENLFNRSHEEAHNDAIDPAPIPANDNEELPEPKADDASLKQLDEASAEAQPQKAEEEEEDSSKDDDAQEAVPLEELDPEIRSLLVEIDHDIVEERVHHPEIKENNASYSSTYDIKDMHTLDSFFEDDERK